MPRGAVPRPFRVERVRDAVSNERQWVMPDGVTTADLRSERFRRLFHGVYVEAAAALTPALLAQGALLLAGPRSIASHHTAARIWGGIVPDDPDTHISCVGKRPRVEGIKAHIAREQQRWGTHRGVPLTSAVTTFLDLATHLGLVDLVVLGDSLVRARRATPDQLVTAAAAYRGKGARLARRAAGLVRCEVDSPMESRLRLLLVLAGLPEPVVNHTIRWPDGRIRYRFDLSYPDHGLVIEYDGRQHAESDTQWGIDLDRREWMDRNGWRLVVVRAKGIFTTPALTVSRIVEAMRDRGMAVPKLSDEWRRHFPGRGDDIATPACRA